MTTPAPETSYPHIASRLYEEPWLILESRYREICEVFETARTRERMGASDPVGPKGEDWLTGKPVYYHPQVEVLKGVALAKVHGVTGKGLSRLAMQCGGFDTGLFREQLRNIADDKAVKALVIDFISPGGMAIGNDQVCAAIQAVKDSGKKVYAYTGGTCASAAYYMASACDHIVADPSAIVGSISTIYAGVDSSEKWKKDGLELKLFSTGKFKATGMPGKEWTKEEEDYIWERVQKLDAEFKGFVSAARPGLKPENMEGQWWYAKQAPKGLIDSTEFESLEQLIEAVYQSL